MQEPPSADTGRRTPGPVPGAGLGVGSGVLLAAIWSFGAWDVALALTAVYASLIVAVAVGAADWRPFVVAMFVASGLAFGAFLLLR